MSSNTTPQFTNRLAQESSPYLLQHAHNPVNWYPWGPEAFEVAKRENKPIFLSVGYSTCYWCHVMERQCFENEKIAAVMNANCINVKVDREERPDVDQLYMTFVQVLTRSGGWPMSVFLTPDLRPIFGGTYFPPEDAHGRAGFPRLVQGVADAYRDRVPEMEPTIMQYVDILKQLAEPQRPKQAMTIDEAWIEKLLKRSTRDFDSHFGGFGSAPKFPRETLLELLLVHNRQHPNPQRMKMLLVTLDALAHGGIRDHLGGGFHRYSTDAKWLVPHFEIMLYDNAMLGWIYAEAFDQTQDNRYATVALDLFSFVLREMTSPDGAFYTAFDAEVDGQEGLDYLWTRDEVVKTLTEALGDESAKSDIDWFCRVYGLSDGPNFADPHHGSGKPDKNILYLAEPVIDPPRIAGGETSPLNEGNLQAMRQILYTARMKRKQPLLDTKILTSWNALMIRALAHAGKVLEDPTFLESAERAAAYLLKHHVQSDGSLYRTSRDGKAKYDAFVDDYAFLAQSLIDLAEATGKSQWRAEAEKIAERMLQKFGDADRGGFYFSAAGAQDLIVRQKTGTDSPLPSGNGVAAMVMLSLGQDELARRTIAAFAKPIDDQCEGMSALVQAAMQCVQAGGAMHLDPGPSAAASTAGAVVQPDSPQLQAEAVVEVEGGWASPTELRIRLLIAPPYHLHANPSAAGFISTELRVSGAAEKNVKAIGYPAGRWEKLAFDDEQVAVYDGTVELAVQFHSVMRKGEQLQLSLIYQACSDTACLPPVTKALEITVP